MTAFEDFVSDQPIASDAALLFSAMLSCNRQKLLQYMEYNFGALEDAELVEALTNHLEVISPDILHVVAKFFVTYARLAMHSADPEEASLALLRRVIREDDQYIVDATAILSRFTSSTVH